MSCSIDRIWKHGGSVAAVALALVLSAALGCAPSEAPAPSEPETEAEVAPAPEPAPLAEWQKRADQIEPTVRAWAEAWSNQDVDAYLSHYAPDFLAPGTLSLEEWKAQRRDRLTRPARIEVTIDDFKQTSFKRAFTGGKQRELVVVRFRQGYSSNTYSDEVTKELQLELRDGEWKIFREIAI